MSQKTVFFTINLLLIGYETVDWVHLKVQDK
jgi:hypothetical protein